NCRCQDLSPDTLKKMAPRLAPSGFRVNRMQRHRSAKRKDALAVDGKGHGDNLPDASGSTGAQTRTRLRTARASRRDRDDTRRDNARTGTRGRIRPVANRGIATAG